MMTLRTQKKYLFIFTFIFSVICHAKSSYIPADLERFQSTNVCVGCDLSEVNIYWETHNNANLTNSLLVKAKLGQDFYSSNFTGAKLMYSHLEYIKASGSTFENADLTDADLSSSNLSSTNFKGARVANVDFSNADLAASNLTQEQLASAKSLSCAILPDGTRHQADSGVCASMAKTKH